MLRIEERLEGVEDGMSDVTEGSNLAREAIESVGDDGLIRTSEPSGGGAVEAGDAVANGVRMRWIDAGLGAPPKDVGEDSRNGRMFVREVGGCDADGDDLLDVGSGAVRSPRDTGGPRSEAVGSAGGLEAAKPSVERCGVDADFESALGDGLPSSGGEVEKRPNGRESAFGGAGAGVRECVLSACHEAFPEPTAAAK